MNRISVAIVTKDRSELLEKTLASLDSQVYRRFEVYIIDNASSDNTREVVENFKQASSIKVFYKKNSENLGLAKARNQALYMCNTEFFTFIDDDDAWSENFLDECIKHATESEVNVFLTSVEYVTETNHTHRVIANIKGQLETIIRQGFAPPVAGSFVRAEAFKKLGGFSEELLSCVDHDLWFKFAENKEIIESIPKAVSFPNKYAIHHERMTTNVERRVSGIEIFISKYSGYLDSLGGEGFALKYKLAYLQRSYLKFAKVAMKKNYFLATGFYYKAMKYGFDFKSAFLFFSHLIGGRVGVNFIYGVRTKLNSEGFITPAIPVKNDDK